jgi:hypothetical protein
MLLVYGRFGILAVDHEMPWGLHPCSLPYTVPRHRPPSAGRHAPRDARTERLMRMQLGPTGRHVVANWLSITLSSSSMHVRSLKTESWASTSPFPTPLSCHRHRSGTSPPDPNHCRPTARPSPSLPVPSFVAIATHWRHRRRNARLRRAQPLHFAVEARWWLFGRATPPGPSR